jgi:hypothetical protein
MGICTLQAAKVGTVSGADTRDEEAHGLVLSHDRAAGLERQRRGGRKHD